MDNPNCPLKLQITKWQFSVASISGFISGFSLDICLDYVNVYDIIDGARKLKKTLCGKGIPLPIQSASNKLFVKFRSDALLNNPGFNATFHTTCEHIFSVLLILLHWFGIQELKHHLKTSDRQKQFKKGLFKQTQQVFHQCVVLGQEFMPFNIVSLIYLSVCVNSISQNCFISFFRRL